MHAKNRLLAAAACIAIAAATHLGAIAASPFSRDAAAFVRDEIRIGINIGNTLDVPSGNETEWGNVPVTRELIRAYRAKGFDTVRVPVSWRKQFDRDDPQNKINPAFLARVKEVVGWCLEEGFVTIVNIHHDGGDDGWPGAWLTIDGEHEPQAEAILRNLWTQIADTFRDAGERLIFEAFNEVRKARRYAGPGGKEAGHENWNGGVEYCAQVNRYGKVFYEAVRATGGNNAKRYLMIPTYAAGFQEVACRLWESPNPEDNRIIADIHCYEPGDFCLWGNRKTNDPKHTANRLNLFFPNFKKYFTDRGIPLVLGEINADLRWYDAEQYRPNDPDRIRWAAQYVAEARSYGFPCIIWESGGSRRMGLIDRKTAKWTHERLVDTFVAAAKGKLTQAQIDAWAAETDVKPEVAYKKTDALLSWSLEDGSYANCWGQTMGYGNRNGNGKTLEFLSSDDSGNLVVNTRGQGGNMIQQQFWPDQSLAARRTWASYVKTHKDLSTTGRKLRIKLTAKNGTQALLKGEITIPGISGKVKFGADRGKDGCVLATPDSPVAVAEVELPEGALNAAGKGLGVELWLIPGDWGRNLPLDAVVSPIEIY